MPTYVYKFVETGETIEVQQSFEDPALTEATHPRTGAVMQVKKVFQPVGVTFKGGGFYKTDARSSTGKGAGTSKSGETTSSSSSSSDTGSATTSSSTTSTNTTSSSTTSSNTTSSSSST